MRCFIWSEAFWRCSVGGEAVGAGRLGAAGCGEGIGGLLDGWNRGGVGARPLAWRLESLLGILTGLTGSTG